MSEHELDVLLFGTTCRLRLEPMVLDLAQAFGTSHSKTTQRTNALVTVSIGDVSGYGESGLPPKKRGIYLADYADVEKFFSDYTARVTAAKDDSSALEKGAAYDPFATLDPQFFPAVRGSQAGKADAGEKAARFLFFQLDQHAAAEPNDYKYQSCNAIETALLDWWARHRSEPLWKLIGVKPEARRAFYTVGLDDIDKMVESCETGLKHSPYLKVKVDEDPAKLDAIMTSLIGYRKQRGVDLPGGISVDTNCAYATPHDAMANLPVFKGLDKALFMVEQPFPAHVHTESTPAQLEEWKKVKQAYTDAGVRIIADESMKNVDDVPLLLPLVHGVNIKLEKTGGIRPGLQAIMVARQAGLIVWIGTMVCSTLGCATVSQLFPLLDWGGDADGSLLVADHSHRFNTRVQWAAKDKGDQWGMLVIDDSPGNGCVLKSKTSR